MENLILPKQYKSELNLHDTQLAIKTVKDFFQALLAQRLHLTRVSAPLFVDPATGLNDNLNGYERPVTFGIKEQDDKNAEVVHSLAKWKRYALKKYGFQVVRTYRDKEKKNTWAFLPLAFLIRLVSKFSSRAKRSERWADELNSDEVLLGGNTLIFEARKI